MRTWGKHLLLQATACRTGVSDKAIISQFSWDLIKRIKMTPFGGPEVVHFGEGDKAGYTLVHLITTSNITAHFCDSTRDMYLDVFSCRDFQPSDVEDLVRTVFQPSILQSRTLLRDAQQCLIQDAYFYETSEREMR